MRALRNPVLAGGLLAALFATSAVGLDPVRVQPNAYRVVLENADLRVLEYNARPGMGVCGNGVHSHPAHLTVLLTAAKVRIRQNGKVFVVEQRPGDVFWSGPVTHETENLGGANVRSLIIELKSPRHGF